MIQEWHCEVCGRGGKTHINDHADAQSGSDRIADSHRRKSPTCHRTRRLEKVRIRAPHCTDKEWEEVLMVVEGYDRREAMNIIKIPRAANVFILEDSSERIAWFMKHIQKWTISKDAREAVRILRKSDEPFDFIFLDHDLGLLDYQGKVGLEGNGQQVAKYLASEGNRGSNVLVHSWNPTGAAAIKAILPDAAVLPFGQFRIEEVT